MKLPREQEEGICSSHKTLSLTSHNSSHKTPSQTHKTLSSHKTLSLTHNNTHRTLSPTHKTLKTLSSHKTLSLTHNDTHRTLSPTHKTLTTRQPIEWKYNHNKIMNVLPIIGWNRIQEHKECTISGRTSTNTQRRSSTPRKSILRERKTTCRSRAERGTHSTC